MVRVVYVVRVLCNIFVVLEALYDMCVGWVGGWCALQGALAAVRAQSACMVQSLGMPGGSQRPLAPT